MPHKVITIADRNYMVKANGSAFRLHPECDAVRDAAFIRVAPRRWVDEQNDPIAMTYCDKFEQTYHQLQRQAVTALERP